MKLCALIITELKNLSAASRANPQRAMHSQPPSPYCTVRFVPFRPVPIHTQVGDTQQIRSIHITPQHTTSTLHQIRTHYHITSPHTTRHIIPHQNTPHHTTQHNTSYGTTITDSNAYPYQPALGGRNRKRGRSKGYKKKNHREDDVTACTLRHRCYLLRGSIQICQKIHDLILIQIYTFMLYLNLNVEMKVYRIPWPQSSSMSIIEILQFIHDYYLIINAEI